MTWNRIALYALIIIAALGGLILVQQRPAAGNGDYRCPDRRTEKPWTGEKPCPDPRPPIDPCPNPGNGPNLCDEETTTTTLKPRPPAIDATPSVPERPDDCIQAEDGSCVPPGFYDDMPTTTEEPVIGTAAVLDAPPAAAVVASPELAG